MNEEQFVQFLRAQQAQQEQINALLALLIRQQNEHPSTSESVTSTPSNSSNNRITILKHFSTDKFNPEKDRIEDFIEFFENKCQTIQITDKSLQKDIILNTITPDTFRQLTVALTPNFEKSTYFDIRGKLLDLYRVKKTRYRALSEFWNCTRDCNDTMEKYANRLKELSKDCGYKGEMLERQLRDRFATGLNHPELETDLKQKWPDLLESGNEVTFQEVFAVALSREQAEHDTQLPSTTSNVNKVKKQRTIKPSHQSNNVIKHQRQRKLHSNQCLRCGNSSKHDFSTCSAREHVCQECNMKGHYESTCIKTGRAYIVPSSRNSRKLNKIRSSTDSTSSASSSRDSYSDDEISVYNVTNTRKSHRDCKQIDVKINGHKRTMDWDPGSSYSIISTEFWGKIGSPILRKGPKLKGYGNRKLKNEGLADVTVDVDGKQLTLPVVVMNDANPMLFGLDWSRDFGMNFPKPVYSIKPDMTTTLKQVLKQHSELFDEKLGKVSNYQVNIHVKSGTEPVHLPARPIKFGVRKNVERELDRLLDKGIINKVDPNITPLEWATPTVNILKPTGEVRICGDYSTTLNPVLTKHLHPVPVFDHLRQKLSNGKIYSKIDLKDAYLQFEVAPESKKFLTISTHKGYYQYNRMPFGISTAPSIFQNFLDQLLGDIPNVAVYFDDIAMTGQNLQQHLHTLDTVLNRLKQAGLKVNLKKCNFLTEEIEYLGHIIDKNGIRPTKGKIDAITKASEPTNSKELRSFLGLINYYERFIPHLHGLCADLYELTSGNRKWRWTKHEKLIFENAKTSIANSKPLIAYDESRHLFLACDASEKGVGAVLYHKHQDLEQPIGFASRKLRPAERKYSVIDREALAILFGIKKFDQYLRGTKFTLDTDHKPLIHILGPQRNLPKLVNNRLVRWALLIGSYQYNINYRKGENNILADCLSRLPNPDIEPTPIERYVHKITKRFLGNSMIDVQLTENNLSKETLKDPILSQIYKLLKTGWRELNYTQEMKHYFRKRNELSTENKIILWQGRMVIPETLRKNVLECLHKGHPGVSSMKALSRFYIWWPSLDEDIENFVKRCHRCQENRPSNPELPIFSWSIPEQVWERVHIDFAGPFEGSYWLVLCDALSKWCELKPMKNITAKSLCLVLDDIFSTFGLPQMIVSDNGPQLVSQEFKDYCKKQGILHVTSAPYHPRTNGLAERFVRTFKNRMSSTDGTPIKSRLQEFLFSYRNTPHTTTGKSPAQMMFGRQLNCVLSNIRPNKRRILQYKQVKSNVMSSAAEYQSGDKVYIKTQEEKKWQPATVATRKHKYSYVVTTSSGVPKRKHADQMRPRFSSSEPETVVTDIAVASTSAALISSPRSTLSPTLTPMPCSQSLPLPSISHSTTPGSAPFALTSPSSSTPLISPATSPSTSSPAFSTPVAEPQPQQLRRSQRQKHPPRRLIDEI